MIFDFNNIASEKEAVQLVLSNLGFRKLSHGFAYDAKELALMIPQKRSASFDEVLQYMDHIHKENQKSLKAQNIYVPFATLYIRISFGKRIWTNCTPRSKNELPDPPDAA